MQREASIAHSTYCRKCSAHYVIASQKIEAAPPTSKSLSKRLGESLTGWFGPKGPRIIQCFECGKRQEVSHSAQSSICPQCSAYIDLQDFYIRSTFTRNFRTRGEVHVTKKGELNSSKAVCGSAIIEGLLRGSLECDGETVVRIKGQLPGSLNSEKVVVEKRSHVEFLRPIKCRRIEIKGWASARIICDGVVHVARKGYLEGTVFAKGITVDKGGQFHGQLTIGAMESTQPELLSAPKNRRKNDPEGFSGLQEGSASA